MELRRSSEFAVLTGSLSFALFMATLMPSVPFGDGGELIAVSHAIGIAHPPGYPWYTLLVKAALLIPLGEPASRANALSALMGAAACGTATLIICRATGSAVAAVAGGLALAGARTFWAAATTTEVYTTHLAMMLGLLASSQEVGLATARNTRGSALIMAGGLLGLGLAHHPTIVLAVPPAVLLLLGPPSQPLRPGAHGFKQLSRRLVSMRPDVSLRSLAIASIVSLGVPVLAYGTLFLRSSAETTWIRLQTLDDLLAHVMASEYRHFDAGWSAFVTWDSWARLGDVFRFELTPFGAICSLLGIARSLDPRLRSSPAAQLGRAALLLFVCGALFGMRYFVADSAPFFLTCVIALSLLAALACAWALASRLPSVRSAGAVSAAALAVLPFGMNLSGIAAPADAAARVYAEDVLSTVPPAGALIVAGDEAFPIAYVQRVLGHRLDITIFHRQGRLFRDIAAEFAISRRPGEPFATWRLRAELEWLTVVLMHQSVPDIYFLGSPGYALALPYQLEPVGMLTRYRRPTDPLRDVAAIQERYHEALVLRHAEQTLDPTALSSAASYSIGRGARALFEGDTARAILEFEQASRRASTVSAIQAFIGGLWFQAGDNERAIAMLRQAVQIQPTSIQAWQDLGVVLESAGRAEEARHAQSRARGLQNAR